MSISINTNVDFANFTSATGASSDADSRFNIIAVGGSAYAKIETQVGDGGAAGFVFNNSGSDPQRRWLVGLGAATGSANFEIYDDISARMMVQITPDGNIIMNLPTADPAVVNALWNNGGAVNISAG